MSDDPSTRDGGTTSDGKEPLRDDNPLDKFDDAIVNADDTGMLAGERLITDAEIEQALENGD